MVDVSGECGDESAPDCTVGGAMVGGQRGGDDVICFSYFFSISNFTGPRTGSHTHPMMWQECEHRCGRSSRNIPFTIDVYV